MINRSVATHLFAIFLHTLSSWFFILQDGKKMNHKNFNLFIYIVRLKSNIQLKLS